MDLYLTAATEGYLWDCPSFFNIYNLTANHILLYLFVGIYLDEEMEKTLNTFID
jgi:hypothetical protein